MVTLHPVTTLPGKKTPYIFPVRLLKLLEGHYKFSPESSLGYITQVFSAFLLQLAFEIPTHMESMRCLAFKGSRLCNQINFNVNHDQWKKVFLEKHEMGLIESENSSQLQCSVCPECHLFLHIHMSKIVFFFFFSLIKVVQDTVRCAVLQLGLRLNMESSKSEQQFVWFWVVKHRSQNRQLFLASANSLMYNCIDHTGEQGPLCRWFGHERTQCDSRYLFFI